MLTRKAPHDSLEFQLRAIWEDLLERQPIGVHEDFFQLGGDSVLAMSLLARIQETGYTLPAGGIFQAPTIAKLAQTLRNESGPDSWSALVPIQPEGTKIPFFCVHPGGGNVLCYLQLARLLGRDQPFYGLQAPGVDGIRLPLTTIAEMSEEYIAAIRQVCPRGPYALGGWSVGGVVAYEMARRLVEQGADVPLVAILDSGVLYALALLTALFPQGEMRLTDMLRQTSHEQLAEFRRRTARAQLIPEEANDEVAARIYRLFAGNMRAILDYSPGPYPGRIDLFQAAESLVKERFSPSREWRSRCGHLEVHRVPGDHLSMVHEPHVSVLASSLGCCLNAI
jgi:thioesterase domain-containing protein/aryl carrier-like protein